MGGVMATFEKRECDRRDEVDRRGGIDRREINFAPYLPRSLDLPNDRITSDRRMDIRREILSRRNSMNQASGL